MQNLASYHLKNVKLLYGIPYYPIFNGIEFFWKLAKDRYRKTLMEHRVNQKLYTDGDLVEASIDHVTQDQASENVRRGLLNILNEKLVRLERFLPYEDLQKDPDVVN